MPINRFTWSLPLGTRDYELTLTNSCVVLISLRLGHASLDSLTLATLNVTSIGIELALSRLLQTWIW